MSQEFENWWTEFRHNMGAFIDEADASKKAAFHAWEDAYKTGYSQGHHDGFADGKRASMKIIDDTFDRYLAGER